MSDEKRNTIIIILSYIITLFITKPIDLRLGMPSYNPFVDGFEMILLISLGVWITTFIVSYLVLNKFLFKNETTK